jgi:peptidoglycan-N-acetylglucosamine deacetylase
MLTVTTSWDDGDVLDIKVAKLLDRSSLKGTFYVPRDYWGERLSDDQIREISQSHEIGAHSLTHADLPKLSAEKMHEEISGSKEWIENITGKHTDMFCYPRGRYTQETISTVREAGFKGARTTELFSLMVRDSFEMATTIQVYPMPFKMERPRSIFEPLQQRYSGFHSLGVPLIAMRSWETAARSAFDQALRKGGVFHLWGHSWEVERYGMWHSLENVFSYMSGREECRYVTNGELI